MLGQCRQKHKPNIGKPMLGQQSFIQQANIGKMLANHHRISIGPTKVQHQISLACQCQPNFGKPVLGQQSFVQRANTGTMLAHHHCTALNQQRPNIRYHWLANVGPTLARQCWASRDFIQRTNHCRHHHTSIGPITVQHQILLVGKCQRNSGFMYNVCVLVCNL